MQKNFSRPNAKSRKAKNKFKKWSVSDILKVLTTLISFNINSYGKDSVSLIPFNRNRVMVFITQHRISITQAKMALSHKACITYISK